MGFLSGILDLFFPPKCIFCGRILNKSSDCVCNGCRQTLPYTKGAGVCRTGNYFDVCVSPLSYEGDVRKSILRFKFKGAVSYADCYGKLLASCIREQLAGKYNLISWVPLSAKRAKDRGYDQAMLLALA
jgi:LSD1 subclass zinc finger protein